MGENEILELIKLAVKRFEVISGHNGFMHDVEYMEFVNYVGYFVPDIHFSVGQALASEKEPRPLAQFCEIWIDHVCIFRELTKNTETEALLQTRKKLLNSLLLHGLQVAYNTINSRDNEE